MLAGSCDDSIRVRPENANALRDQRSRITTTFLAREKRAGSRVDSEPTKTTEKSNRVQDIADSRIWNRLG